MAIEKKIVEALSAAKKAKSAAQQAYDKAVQTFDSAESNYNELARQYKEHLKNQNWTEVQNISPAVTAAEDSLGFALSDKAKKKADLDAAIEALDEAQYDYDRAYEDDKKYNALLAINPAAAAAFLEQTNKAKEAAANAAGAMQGTTKYLIFGAIALVVVVIGIIVFRKKLAA